MVAHRTDADVVVVGGGPAGATVAALLARRSHRVLLLHEGRDPPAGTTTLFPGLRATVNELGLLTRLDATALRRCSGLEVTGPDGRTRRTRFGDRGPHPFGHHVERADLDRLLRDRAAELGATVLASPVRDVLRRRTGAGRTERVVGVRHGGGSVAETTARLVIDASGAARVVAGRVQQGFVGTGPARAVLRVGLRDLPDPGERSVPLRVGLTGDRDGWTWVTPRGGDRGELSWSVPAGGMPDPGGRLRALLPAGTRTEGPVVRRAYRTRTALVAHGPGWAAVGDAHMCSDPPLTAGATLAVTVATPLAQAVHQVLTGRSAERAALTRYAAGVRDLLADVAAFARSCAAVSEPVRPGPGHPGAGLDVLLCGAVVLRRPYPGSDPLPDGSAVPDAPLGPAPDAL